MHIVIIKGKKKYHWRVMGANGEIVLSSQGYHNRWNAKRAAKRLAKLNFIELSDPRAGR